MRTFCSLFVLAMATNTFAQEPVKPYGTFYGPLANGSWNPKPVLDIEKLRRTYTGKPAQSISANCSVPLLEAQIPQDVRFTMVQKAPDMDKVEPMPHAQVPAPPCTTSK